jgi:hypothetical protein
MVGNYLTTLNQPVEKDLQMLKDLGLDPCWDNHGFADQQEDGCGCESGNCETETVITNPNGIGIYQPGVGASAPTLG